LALNVKEIIPKKTFQLKKLLKKLKKLEVWPFSPILLAGFVALKEV